MAEMSTTYISTLPTGSAGGSKYLVQDDGNNTTKVTVNDAVASATAITSANSSISTINSKIGTTTLPTTAQTLTGAIAEHEGDITALNGRLSAINATARHVGVNSNTSFTLTLEDDHAYLVTMMTTSTTSLRCVIISRRTTYVQELELAAGSWQSYYTESISGNTWTFTAGAYYVNLCILAIG